MKKGFTLIELLAVIVILAVIALIATPTITEIIEKARIGSVEQSAKGYIDSIEKQKAINLMDSDSTNDINEGVYDAPLDSYNVKVKGNKPSSGWVEVTKDGVNRYSLVIVDYVVSYDGTKVEVKKGDTAETKIEIPRNPVAFNTDSWTTIINAVKTNNTSVYHVGDTKDIDMGEFGTHTVRIANMSTPSECSTEGFSQTACGFVLEFSDIITKHAMNGTHTDVGGWPASSMREHVNSNIYNSLPSDLKSGIMDTFVVSGHGITSGEINFTSTDKLYLLSTKEVWGKDSTSLVVKNDTAEAETRQLDYYKESGVTTSNYSGAIKKLKGDNDIWWLRAANSGISDTFYYVSNSGVWSGNNANYTDGVAQLSVLDNKTKTNKLSTKIL